MHGTIMRSPTANACTLILVVILCASFCARTSARQWIEVIPKKQTMPRDRFRYQSLLEEHWSFEWTSVINESNIDAGGEGNSVPAPNTVQTPARNPTAPRTSKPSLRPTNQPTTLRPTPAPISTTSAPIAPTASPTKGSLCPSGYAPYEIHMYDRWGDGWEGTTLSISPTLGYEESFRGSLTSGHKSIRGFCLSTTKCHQVSVQGVSAWNAEIYW